MANPWDLPEGFTTTPTAAQGNQGSAYALPEGYSVQQQPQYQDFVPDDINTPISNAEIAASRPTTSPIVDRVQRGFSSSILPPSSRQVEQDVLGAARSTAQGTTFGFADELEAGARALFSDRGYSEIRNDIRGQNQQFSEANPVGATATEVIGSIPTALFPAGWVGRGTSTANRIGRGATIGAAEGTIYGTGASTADTVEGVATDAGIGAATGAILTPALSTLGSVALKSLSNIPGVRQKLLGETSVRADNQIRQWARDNNIDVRKVQNELKVLQEQVGANDGVKLADADDVQSLLSIINKDIPLDPTLQRELQGRASSLREGAADTFDAPRSSFLDAAEAESFGLSNQALGVQLTPQSVVNRDPNSLLQNIGQLNLSQLGQDVVVNANRNAAARYNAAYTAPFDETAITHLTADPVFKRANRVAVDNTASDVATGRIVRATPVKVLDETKRELDRLYTAADNAGNASAMNRIMRVRSQLIAELDTQVPDYAEARRLASIGQQQRAGIEAGAGTGRGADSTPLFNRPIEQTKRDTLAASGEAKEAMRLGLGRTVRDTLEAGKRGPDGRLLTEQQVFNVSNISGIDDYNYLNNLNQAEGVLNRTAQIAERTSGNLDTEIQRQLAAGVGTDANAALALANVATPGGNVAINAIFAVARTSKSIMNKLKTDQRNVYQAIQNRLYQDFDPKQVNEFLRGDLTSVPIDVAQGINRIIAQATSNAAVSANTN